MKKLMLLILASALATSLCACGGSSSSTGTSSSSTSSGSSASAPATSTPKSTQGMDYDTTLGLPGEDGTAETYAVSGTYSGPLSNGIPDGEGVFTSEDVDGGTWTYKGEFSNGYFDGYGELTMSDGSIIAGAFEKGVYSPSKADYFLTAQSYYQSTTTMTPAAKEFIDAHEDLFPCETDEAKAEAVSLTDTGLSWKMINKSPNQYGDQMFTANRLEVVQIFETPDAGWTLTWILAIDNEFNYYAIYYLGSVDVYEGDTINIRVLPMGTSSFDNVSGGTTLVVACAGSIVEKA